MNMHEDCGGWRMFDAVVFDGNTTSTVDGQLDDIWRRKKWEAANLDMQLLPWPMRADGTPQSSGGQSVKTASPLWEGGWFSPSYPVLAPYYPLPTVDTNFIDAWSVQDYQGVWW